MWIIVLAIRPATVEIYTSESKRDMKKVNVGGGITKLSSPLKAGGGIKLVMSRDGVTVAECTPVGYRFEARPGVYNFNVFVAMSV
jgi:glucan endo-1,3-alpha-glucosidase